MAQSIAIHAPVAGTVDDVRVAPGDAVAQGAVLAVQNLTKTETQVSAPVAGRVKSVARRGTALAAGDVLAEIEF